MSTPPIDNDPFTFDIGMPPAAAVEENQVSISNDDPNDQLPCLAVVSSTAHLLGLARALEVAGYQISTFVTQRKARERWNGILRPAYCPTHTLVPGPRLLIVTDNWDVAQLNRMDVEVMYLKLDAQLPPNIYALNASVPFGRRFRGYAIVEPRELIGNMGRHESGAVTYIITSAEPVEIEVNSFDPLVEMNGKLVDLKDRERGVHTTLPALLARLTEPAPFALPWVFHFVRVGAAEGAHTLPPGFDAAGYYWSDIRRSPEGTLSVHAREREPLAWAVGWGKTFSRARRDAHQRAAALGALPGLWAYWRSDSGAVSDGALAMLDEKGML